MRISLPCPYFSQYDNQLHPGGSCNMTALAMALAHYGKTVDGPYARIADNLLWYCDQHGLDRHALEVIAQMARMHGIADEASYTTSMAEVKAHVATGDITIIQGAYTGSGHVVPVVGFDEEKGVWIVNDSAGLHTPSGYDGYASGDHVEYPSAWFVPASAPDGQVWAHRLHA